MSPRKSSNVSLELRGDSQRKLRQGGLKLTGPRRRILELLESARQPLTPKQLFETLPAGQCDLVTVYRTLQLLETLHLVKRFHLSDGAAHYVLLRDERAGHQHHLVCTQCARIVEVGECVVRELEQRLAERSRFKALSHRLEFFGICPSCQ